MPFYRRCSIFAADSLGELDAFSHMCIETAYGANGASCDATYMQLGLADVALACGCSSPGCGLAPALMGGQAGGDARFTAGCAAEFETVYARCSEFIRGPAARVDASAWESFLAQCQASTHSDIGNSCEEQCAARYPNEDQQADACACTYGCHASEAGQDAGACLETCDSQCDRGKQCACECGAAGTCSDCTSADQCETPCSVGCSLVTDDTSGFSGLMSGFSGALDTAEENVSDGTMYLDSSDLEL